MINWLKALRDACARRHPASNDRTVVFNDVGGWVVERDRSRLSNTDEIGRDQMKVERIDQLTSEEAWPMPFP
jgi:hypothetical protein